MLILYPSEPCISHSPLQLTGCGQSGVSGLLVVQSALTGAGENAMPLHPKMEARTARVWSYSPRTVLTDSVCRVSKHPPPLTLLPPPAPTACPPSPPALPPAPPLLHWLCYILTSFLLLSYTRNISNTLFISPLLNQVG